MSLTFAQAQFALAFVNDIDPARADAFEARLKQWQKMGFPEGVNVGRGQRAAYGATQVHQLLFMLKLLQVGLTPERAQKVVLSGWEAFKDAITETLLCMANGEEHLHYCLIQLDAMSELKKGNADHMHIFVDTFTSDEMVDAFLTDDEFLSWREEAGLSDEDAPLRQHQYISYLTKNRLATCICIEVDSLLLLLWVALKPMGLTPAVFATEIAEWERVRRARGRVPQAEQAHFETKMQAESVVGRLENFSGRDAAWEALSEVDETSIRKRED